MPRPEYPRHRLPEVADDSAPISAEWVRRAMREVLHSLEDMATLLTDQSHRVDEFQPSGVGESTTSLNWQPNYKTDEIITGIIVTGPTTPIEPVQQYDVENSTTSPGAGTVVVTSAAGQPAGIWTFEWTVELSGTLAAADANNFGLYVNGVLVATSINPAVAGVYPQQPVTDLAIAAVNTVQIRAIALGTVAAVYTATLVGVQQPSNPPTFVLTLDRRVWTLQLPPTGILTISPVALEMKESSTRTLTSAVAGDWAVELVGYTDTGRRGRV